MRLSPLAAPLVLVLALVLTSCGGDDATPAGSQGATQDGDSVALTVTREGGELTPNGERVELAVDQTLVLTIDDDEAGELHVHSTPEQEIEYPAGTTDKTLTIKQPGVVDVESHDLDQLIVQLEVR